MAHDEFPKWDYNEYPKTLPPDDLWGQVRRTVYGKAISEDQIQLIVDAIVAGLEIPPARALLDIGCGNAALSERLFPHCDQCLGVDASEYLISVANARFASPRHRFICQDALEYVEKETEPLAFDKVLCFAVLPYLSDENAERLLTTLARRFQHVRSVFVGNLPDPNCVSRFFKDSAAARTELDNPESQIGVWRSRDQLSAMAAQTGWRIRFQDMPTAFYQAHYRYNAVLERPV